MRYTHFDHRHSFAVWAAARAAQRGFTSTSKLRRAIEACGVVDYVQDHSTRPLTKGTFDNLHRTWCRGVISDLTAHGVASPTFGRAAKLVAVYLKAMVIVGPDSDSDLARVAHPPIDRLLLQNLAADPGVSSAHKTAWKSISWTTLDERRYYELMRQLATCLPPEESLWLLERHWTVTRERRPSDGH